VPKFKFLSFKTTAIVLLSLTLLGGGLMILSEELDLPDAPRGPRVASACTQAWPQLPNNIAPQSLKPRKVVVQPWKGRHHVYAEFDLPSQGYLINHQFRVSLDSLGDFCGSISEASSEPGKKGIAIAYFRTRTTLWLIAQGKLNALTQPDNWQLEVVPLNSLIPDTNPASSNENPPSR
jgi:hypothetical protein